MRWLKKGNFIAVGVVAVAIAVFCGFFMDPLIKWGLIKAGQSAVQAKVEIGGLKTSLFSGRLEIRRLATANRNDPMKNLLELEQASFQFSPGQALRGKVVIPEASILGLRFGTARKTSGALALSRRPSAIAKMVEKELAPAKDQALSKIGEVKAVAAELDPKKLTSLKALDESSGRLKELSERWKGKLEVAKIDGEIKQIQEQVKSLQGGGSTLGDIALKAKTAQDTQSKISGLLKDVESSKNAVTQELNDVRATIKKAEELKNKDLNGLLQAAGLPALDAESLAKRMLGPATANKISTGLTWVSWTRKQMASPKSKQAQAPPRRKGINIEFPVHNAKPAFLLEKALLSGVLASIFQGRDMKLEGALYGATSNPPLYGKPARLVLKGAVPNGGPRMGLEGLIDQTKTPGSTELSFLYEGLPLTGTELGDGELGAAIKSGLARINGSLRISGDNWKGQFVVQAAQVSLEPRLGLKGPAAQYAALALQGINKFSATIGVEGSEDDLHFKISSDLGQSLAQGMQKAVSSAFADQRKLLESKLNALYADKANALRNQTESLQASLLAPLNRQDAALREALKNAAAKSLGKSLPNLNKLFGR